VYVDGHLSFYLYGKAVWGNVMVAQEDSGNPTLRDEKGGLWKHGLWWN
jgi:hypothetical protein